ncbi:MAG: hypothetical protein PUE59_05575 [Treponema sp.]|nr:hypothetical protein [Treponema sp.]
MLIDVKGSKGYVFDNKQIQHNKEGAKYANAYFDEKRAKELGLTKDEIEEEKKLDKIVLVDIREE